MYEIISSIDDLDFHFFLTKPDFPVIILAGDRLYTAFSYRKIAKTCIKLSTTTEQVEIKVLDFSSREFYYLSEKRTLMPNIAVLRWTKKQIIETFNNSLNAREKGLHYPLKYVSSRRFDRIFNDICQLIRQSNK